MKRNAKAICLSALVLGLTAPAHAPAAAAPKPVTLTGTVVCQSGRAVTGVWIEVSGGTSGWAKRTALPDEKHVAYYTFKVKRSGRTTKVHPTVGCGGSKESWGSSNSAPKVTVSADYVYNVRCNDPKKGNGACAGAPHPGGNGTNLFYAGQCTWGAAELWKKATGAYPLWNGNAKDWDDNAKAAGFYVSRVPQPRSVAVWEDSSSGHGHVAWVTRTKVSRGKVVFRVREMNWEREGVWSERDVTHSDGVSFIVAKPGRKVVKL